MVIMTMVMIVGMVSVTVGVDGVGVGAHGKIRC
jgi:hypothetical protein